MDSKTCAVFLYVLMAYCLSLVGCEYHVSLSHILRYLHRHDVDGLSLRVENVSIGNANHCEDYIVIGIVLVHSVQIPVGCVFGHHDVAHPKDTIEFEFRIEEIGVVALAVV